MTRAKSVIPLDESEAADSRQHTLNSLLGVQRPTTASHGQSLH